MRDLTEKEHEILDSLGSVMGEMNLLPVVHPDDADEAIAHIHALQNIVLARPATEITFSETRI